MNILLHPSLREGLARVLSQALLLKKPVVSFALDGAGEVIINNKTGFLVPPKDTEGLSTFIMTLLDDESKAKEMGNQGYELVKDLFDSKKMVTNVNKLYNNLLDIADNI